MNATPYTFTKLTVQYRKFYEYLSKQVRYELDVI